MRWWQILDVIGENGVEIAHAVWAGEGEIGAIIFIDQRYRFMREPVFALPIAEIIGQSAAEPHDHFHPGLLMQPRDRRSLDSSCSRPSPLPPTLSPPHH